MIVLNKTIVNLSVDEIEKCLVKVNFEFGFFIKSCNWQIVGKNTR